MRIAALSLALAVAALCGLPATAAAQSPIIQYRYSFRSPSQPRFDKPAPQTGFYRDFARAAIGYNSAAIHAGSPPVDTVWEQAQGINPTWIINPFADLDESTLRLIESPFRNCPIQRAADSPRYYRPQ